MVGRGEPGLGGVREVGRGDRHVGPRRADTAADGTGRHRRSTGRSRRTRGRPMSSRTSRAGWRRPVPMRRPTAMPAMCFLDLTGYTRLTQERGDEAAARLAADLSRLTHRTSNQHGGRPVKWLGDGVMFWFREPRPCRDRRPRHGRRGDGRGSATGAPWVCTPDQSSFRAATTTDRRSISRRGIAEYARPSRGAGHSGRRRRQRWRGRGLLRYRSSGAPGDRGGCPPPRRASGLDARACPCVGQARSRSVS